MYQKLFKLFKFYNSSKYKNDFLYKNILGKRIIIYGTGQGYITFKNFVLDKYNIKIHVCLDRKYHKSFYKNQILYTSIENYKPKQNDLNNSVVIITIGNKKTRNTIFKKLKDIGFKEIYYTDQILEYHLHYDNINLINNGCNFFFNNKGKIFKAFNYLNDDKSKQIFISFLKTFMNQKVIKIDSNNLNEQYFPKDIKLTKGYQNFINCGAYNGDTIKNLYNKFGTINKLLAFEPDMKNYKNLLTFIKDKPRIAKEIIILPLGLYSKTKIMYFHQGNQTNSAVSKNGNVLIQCVALDDILTKFYPTYITMDIEGSELEALKGAKKNYCEI